MEYVILNFFVLIFKCGGNPETGRQALFTTAKHRHQICRHWRWQRHGWGTFTLGWQAEPHAQQQCNKAEAIGRKPWVLHQHWRLQPSRWITFFNLSNVVIVTKCYSRERNFFACEIATNWNIIYFRRTYSTTTLDVQGWGTWRACSSTVALEKLSS